jgi:hypothetical protein
MKAAERKKMATAPKAATIVASKIVVASTPKASAMPRASAAPMTCVAASKAAAAGQKGATGTTKVMTLKVKSGVKRPADMEISLAKDVKESKMFSLASTSVPALTRGADAPSSPPPESGDDDRIELISMLGVVSTSSSSSSSSSSVSSPSESIRALRPDMDVVISFVVVIPELELQTIRKMAEIESIQPEADHTATEPNAPLRVRGSTSTPLD